MHKALHKVAHMAVHKAAHMAVQKAVHKAVQKAVQKAVHKAVHKVAQTSYDGSPNHAKGSDISRVGQIHIYILCIYGIFGREITKYTVIYGIYIRFWQTLDIR